MRILVTALLTAGLGGCIWISDTELDDRFEVLTDQDGDGYQDKVHGGDDCDDGDATVHPGATETCNGVDDDCSGSADDELLDTLLQLVDEERKIEPALRRQPLEAPRRLPRRLPRPPDSGR